MIFIQPVWRGTLVTKSDGDGLPFHLHGKKLHRSAWETIHTDKTFPEKHFISQRKYFLIRFWLGIQTKRELKRNEIVLVHSRCSPCLRGDKTAETISPRRKGEHRETVGGEIRHDQPTNLVNNR